MRLLSWRRRCSYLSHLASTSTSKLVALYEHIFGSKPKTTKITLPSVKGDHPKIDDSTFQAEKGIHKSISCWSDNFRGRDLWGDSALWWLSWRCHHSDLHQEKDISIKSSEFAAIFPRWSIQSSDPHWGTRLFRYSKDEVRLGIICLQPCQGGARKDVTEALVSLLSLQPTSMLTCIIACWQGSQCLEVCTCSTRLQPIGMRRSQVRQRQLYLWFRVRRCKYCGQAT